MHLRAGLSRHSWKLGATAMPSVPKEVPASLEMLQSLGRIRKRKTKAGENFLLMNAELDGL